MTKVTVCGAAGGIGQPLSLMLKLNPFVSDLSLYDVVNIPGVAKDLSHIDTDTKISYHLKSDNNNTGLSDALKNSDIVIIPAGVPRKPGMTRDDLFRINAGINVELAQGIVENCPNAFILVISNPINSIVPLFTEILKKNNVLNPKKLFGVSTLDSVRSNTMIADLCQSKIDKKGKESLISPDDCKPNSYNIRVIGGHSGETIVPLFSVCSPQIYSILEDDEIDSLIHRVQYGGDEIVEAKQGAGSATLSMAYAGYKFVHGILGAINGNEGIIESSYIYLGDDSVNGVKESKEILKKLTNIDSNELSHFALPILFDKDGIKEVKFDILNRLNSKELEMLKICCDQLVPNITKGTSFLTN